MFDFLELLKYVLPSGIVFATSYYLTKTFFDKQYKDKLIEIRAANQKIITPIRLQSYERLALLLERISPNSLIMRVMNRDMSANQFREELIQNIRNEFEHNLSQQIYISSEAWELIKNAKEETIKLINISTGKINDNASAIELSKVILELTTQVEKLPTTVALDYLKKEIRQTF
jgi:hypothetical protein